MLEKVIAILREYKQDETLAVTESSTFSELGFDSLDIVELIMDLEQEFNIEIPDEELPKVQTVADIVGYLDKK